MSSQFFCFQSGLPHYVYLLWLKYRTADTKTCCKIAAWQMPSCPIDAKGRRYWEEVVTWRCDERWVEAFVNLTKEDHSNTTQWKRPHTGRCTYWEMPFTRFFGDAWIPKLKRCKTWTEWLSLTKDFEYAWHSLLNLKYTSDIVKVGRYLRIS